MEIRQAGQSAQKAIILDLDGTLLHTDKSISAYTLEMLRRCKEKGIVVIVATARFWFKAEKYPDQTKPDYAILADGTQIYHHTEMIYGCTMEQGQSAGMIEALSGKSRC